MHISWIGRLVCVFIQFKLIIVYMFEGRLHLFVNFVYGFVLHVFQYVDIQGV